MITLQERVRAAIVGTGFAGIGMAISLKRAGMDDFVLLERAEDVGGTWRDNSYPGCQCDVPSSLYSFSFALNPDWSRTYSPQPEIRRYLQDTTRRFGVTPHIRLGHEVLSARWDEDEKVWEIETSRGAWRSDVLILGNGGLSEPAIPDLPGRDLFKGIQMHSAAWDHDVDLKGKKVAVVGTGASAIQIVPRLQPIVDLQLVFQRTPSWVLPHPDRPTTRFERELYRRAPLAQRAARAGVYLSRELMALGMTKNQRLLWPLRKISERHLEKQVSDPILRRALTPRFEIGCKRLLVSNDFYPALSQPNTRLVPHGVAALSSDGIIDAAGESHEVDVIVWATGFHVIDNPIGHKIKGRRGATLADVWSEDGMKAYLGTTVAGFPNMFMMTGPNTGQGHTSLVFMAEAQMAYVTDALRFMSDNDIGSVEVIPAVVDAFNREIDRKMSRSVWTTGGCVSWYLDEHGRNPTLWPDFTWRFKARTRRFDPLCYLVAGRG